MKNFIPALQFVLLLSVFGLAQKQITNSAPRAAVNPSKQKNSNQTERNYKLISPARASLETQLRLTPCVKKLPVGERLSPATKNSEQNREASSTGSITLRAALRGDRNEA